MMAVILAAGKGTRLKYLTEIKPKPLLPINGVAIIGWTLKSLLKIPTITEIIIVTGYMHEQINAYIKTPLQK